MKNVIWLGLVWLAVVGTEVSRAGHESHGDGEFSGLAHLQLVEEVADELKRSGDVIPLSDSTLRRLNQKWLFCNYRSLSGEETLAVVTTIEDYCLVAVRPRVWRILSSRKERWMAMCDALLRDALEQGTQKACTTVWGHHSRAETTLSF